MHARMNMLIGDPQDRRRHTLSRTHGAPTRGGTAGLPGNGSPVQQGPVIKVLLGNRWGNGRQRAGRPDRSQACDRTPRARRTGWGRRRSWTTRSRCCPVRAGGSGEQASHSLIRSGSTGNLTTMKITSLFLWTPALVWLPAQVLNAVDNRSGFPIRKFHRFHEGYS